MWTGMKSQLQWLDQVKTNGCFACHALGTKATRTIPEALGTFKNSVEAWERRIQSGQAMTGMAAAIGRQDPKISLANFADWTDRIKAGELPFAKPERPQGVERNVVITQWDWGTPKIYMHDQVSTDKRKPTVNAYGKHYGATEESSDFFPVFDPKTNSATMVHMPVRDADMESTKSNTMAPSAYWGDEAIWDSKTSMHNPRPRNRQPLRRPNLHPLPKGEANKYGISVVAAIELTPHERPTTETPRSPRESRRAFVSELWCRRLAC